ncbi:unnamed protein product, partial [Timema podura]|nr:unnamed protein product [Timema podura]
MQEDNCASKTCIVTKSKVLILQQSNQQTSGDQECLDGPDPKSSRPRLLHIRAKGSKVIDLSEV